MRYRNWFWDWLCDWDDTFFNIVRVFAWLLVIVLGLELIILYLCYILIKQTPKIWAWLWYWEDKKNNIKRIITLIALSPFFLIATSIIGFIFFYIGGDSNPDIGPSFWAGITFMP